MPLTCGAARTDGAADQVVGSVLARQFGVEAARELVAWHPTLSDVDTPGGPRPSQEPRRVIEIVKALLPSPGGGRVVSCESSSIAEK